MKGVTSRVLANSVSCHHILYTKIFYTKSQSYIYLAMTIIIVQISDTYMYKCVIV